MKWSELKNKVEEVIKDNNLQDPDIIHDDAGTFYDVNNVKCIKEDETESILLH
jgi:hypothetical protein